MCGFTGYVGITNNDKDLLENMMNTIVHRGPDSSGMYIDEEAALGFRRLSIIDISDAGNQPISNEDDSKVLVFNGEIYNYKILREELLEKGHVFKTHTDSETILHAFEEWGERVVDHLRGMYAFVIWDKSEKKLYGARDMFGIKPFYYAQMNDTFFFGSEIKSFLVHPKFDKQFNEDVLKVYLSFQYVPTNETFFKGVFCLQPGHFFTYQDGKIEITRYFEPNFSGDTTLTYEEAVCEVEKVMRESVAAHMVSDVEVGSYLSSGVDSSYIAYLGQVDRTFTVGFHNEKYSEIPDVKKFAESINMTNDSKIIEPDEYWDVLSDAMYFMDEPLADPAAVALYFLSAEASKKVKVVLSGEGSDELFGGYNVYCEPFANRKFDKIPMWIRKAVARFAETCLPKSMKGRAFLIRRGQRLEDWYIGNGKYISEKEAERILLKDCKLKCTDVTAPFYARVQDKDNVTKMQYLDMHLWLVHDILMKGDKMGMANSLEVRVPFLDKHVMNFAMSLPVEYRLNVPETKIALRAAVGKEIRKETANKKKLGFPIPIREWMKEEKYFNLIKEKLVSDTAKKYFDSDYMVKLLEDHREGKVDNSRRVWTIYAFLLWHERFFETDCPVHPWEKQKKAN